MEVTINSSALIQFEQHLFLPEADVHDPDGVHHEFNQGLHGQKTDMDKVVEGTPLYDEWIENEAEFIDLLYAKKLLGRAVLIGVANGTNRVARDTSRRLDRGIGVIQTRKAENGKPELTPEAIELLAEIDPILALIIEDVGTRGTNVAFTLNSLQQFRPPNLKRIEVINTVQRGVLEWLDGWGIVYHSMIKRLTQDYTAAQCARRGFCAKNWRLIPYGQQL